MDLLQHIQQLNEDISEFRHLLSVCTRPSVKQYLEVQIVKLEAELQATNERRMATISSNRHPQEENGCALYEKKITQYCWDQSDKFVKIYLTLNDIEQVPKDNFHCTFEDRSFRFTINDYKDANHVLSISGLLHDIVPDSSSFQVKKNTVIIKLTKKNAQSWTFLTEADHIQTEKSKPKFDSLAGDKDPGESLIDLMRKMYEDGDDYMKRTIARAWTESREKLGKGYDPAADI